MPRKHAVLSASGSHRWMACPGSIRMCEGIPKTSSIYADEGTAYHMLGEMVLKSPSKRAFAFQGMSLGVRDHKFLVDDEMIETVQVYVDAVVETLEAAGKGAELRIEHKFNLDWLYPGLFGTNDALVGEAYGTLYIFDLKAGRGVAVEAERNSQLMYYAVGAAYGDDYADAELVIVQPRAVHPDGPTRRWRISTADLMTWAREVLLPAAKATEDPAAPLAVGDHCRFCDALAVCPAQHEHALAVAGEVFSEAPSAPPAPETLSLEQIRRVLDGSDMVEAWINACRDYARQQLEHGQVKSVDLGYKLVPGRASRKWKDEGEAAATLEMSLGDEAYIRKLLSPAQAEKVLKDKKLLESMVEVTRGVQLAPLSDKRDEIVPAITVFTEVAA